ncbi:MAG: hypothetical protein QGG98_00575 [Pseudomonadales bacterium]|nr:hypothetical protein [Pseudomonadales bacterium]
MQWIQPNRLDRYAEIGIAVITAASGGAADRDPVGGTVAGPLKPIRFDEGL